MVQFSCLVGAVDMLLVLDDYDLVSDTSETLLSVSIPRHPVTDIQKRAKQLLFGFEAMDNLKTHTMSYGVGQGYKEYFEKIKSDWDLTYFDKERLEDMTEDESDFPAALLLSGFIFLLPVLAVLALAYMS